MAEGRFVSYLRVSTARQGRSGLGLEAQRQAVANYLNGGRWSLVAEVVEIESGGNDDRTKLTEALRLCRLHKATLVIAKLDRLSRNAGFLHRLEDDLKQMKLRFVAADMPDANELTLHIMAAVAQAERTMISERTKVALSAAKARGVKLGGDRGNIHQIRTKGAAVSASRRAQEAVGRAQDVYLAIQDLRASGASLRAMAGHLNETGVPTVGRGEWSATQVARIIARAEGRGTADSH